MEKEGITSEISWRAMHPSSSHFSIHSRPRTLGLVWGWEKGASKKKADTALGGKGGNCALQGGVTLIYNAGCRERTLTGMLVMPRRDTFGKKQNETYTIGKLRKSGMSPQNVEKNSNRGRKSRKGSS